VFGCCAEQAVPFCFDLKYLRHFQLTEFAYEDGWF
jgi:hypothetical protein